MASSSGMKGRKFALTLFSSLPVKFPINVKLLNFCVLSESKICVL